MCGGIVPLHPASDGSRRQFLFKHLADTVVPRGFGVMRFDRRPSPNGGDVPFAAQADDALQALDALRAAVGEVPLGLWAWSQGAWAAALAAARSSDVAFLVLLAACGVSPAVQMRYGTAEHLRRNGFGDEQAMKELAELRAALEDALRDHSRLAASQAVVDRYADRPWFPLVYVPRTLDPAAEWPDMDFDPAPIIAEVRCPVLLFYGEEDEWTPIEPSIAAWQDAGNADLTVVRLAGTDHAPTSAAATNATRSAPSTHASSRTGSRSGWTPRRPPKKRLLWTHSVAISRPEPRRRPKLPWWLQITSDKPTRGGRKTPRLPRGGLPRGRRLPQPYSRADAPYFRSPGFYVRVGGLAVIVAAGLALLLLRAWSIQVLHGKQYAKAARVQAYRTVNVLGARGAIVDDHRRLIAGTTGHVVVDADAASLGSRNAHGRWNPSPAGLRELGRLAVLARTRRSLLVRRIRHDVLQSPFAPAAVLPHPTLALTSYLQERSGLYPGFKVEADGTRSYPQGAFGSEFLGLLGQIDPQQLKSGAYKKAQPGEVVGQSGVEAAYDSILNDGFVQAKIPVDSLGRIAGALRVPRQKQPPTLQLSIDTRLQRAAQNALLYGMEQARLNGHSPTGASAVAINPWTGAIKAIVSYPTFNQKLAANKPSYLARLYHQTYTTPTLNRAIGGVYPTGSTFKPIISEAALSAGIITPYTPQACTGSFTLGNHTFLNVERGANETMSLPTALEQSCDTWFYRLGARIWAADPARKATLIQSWARRLGLGTRPPIDLTGAAAGYLPMPGSYFERLSGTPYTEGQAVNLAVGQGALQVSPLQLAVAYSALINGGKVVRPHVGEAVIRNGVKHQLRFKPVRKLHLSPYTWAIRQGLYEAANNVGGTSQPVFAGFPIKIAGKTGTAEAPPGSDHSWYASWAPYDHPKLVVVAMIEHGGFGAEAAAPTVKRIYQAYFHLKP